MPRIEKTGFIRTLTIALTALLALGFSGLAAKAWAAEFTPTDVNISIDRDTVTAGWDETIETTVNFKVPNSAQAGDTFTVTLPSILTDWPDSFMITNGPDGVDAINVTISDTNPAVATFTLTEQGADIENLRVTAHFGANIGSTPDGHYELTFLFQGSVAPIVIPIDVGAPAYHVPFDSHKSGWFADDSDQCRTNTSECVIFNIETSVQPSGLVEVVDNASGTWEFACSAGVEIWINHYVAGGGSMTNSYIDTIGAGDAGFDCSGSQLSFEVDADELNLGEFDALSLLYRGNATMPGGNGEVDYVNDATVTTKQWVDTPGATVTSAYVGGFASGDSITIVKKDEHGNDANTEAEAVLLPTGATGLRFTIENTGISDLYDITVSDEVTIGSAKVKNLSCDFYDLGGPQSATSWQGPLLPGEFFECTAELSGVNGPHSDTAKVTASGNGPVEDEDDYFANPPTMNLVLAKELTAVAPFYAGDEVQFTLTPANDGDYAAAAGWSVTDVLPAGLTLVGMSGDGYVCTANVCVADDALAAGETGGPITLTATIDATATGPLHNVAYVSPVDGDIAETNPLVIPETDTDTAATETDNDAQADLELSVKPSATPSTASSTPEPTQTPTVTPSSSEAPSVPALPKTDGSMAGLIVAVATVLVGGTALAARRRR